MKKQKLAPEDVAALVDVFALSLADAGTRRRVRIRDGEPRALAVDDLEAGWMVAWMKDQAIVAWQESGGPLISLSRPYDIGSAYQALKQGKVWWSRVADGEPPVHELMSNDPVLSLVVKLLREFPSWKVRQLCEPGNYRMEVGKPSAQTYRMDDPDLPLARTLVKKLRKLDGELAEWKAKR